MIYAKGISTHKQTKLYSRKELEHRADGVAIAYAMSNKIDEDDKTKMHIEQLS